MRTNAWYGIQGEEAAASFLKEMGYKVLYRNYKVGFDEIDIIARSPDKTLCFVEVKTFFHSRSNLSESLMPEDNFTSSKIHKLRRSAQMFVGKHQDHIYEQGFRIDGVCVLLFGDSMKPIIRHYENIE